MCTASVVVDESILILYRAPAFGRVTEFTSLSSLYVSMAKQTTIDYWIIMIYLLNAYHILRILSIIYHHVLKYFFVSNFSTLFHVSIFIFFNV